MQKVSDVLYDAVSGINPAAVSIRLYEGDTRIEAEVRRCHYCAAVDTAQRFQIGNVLSAKLDAELLGTSLELLGKTIRVVWAAEEIDDTEYPLFLGQVERCDVSNGITTLSANDLLYWQGSHWYQPHQRCLRSCTGADVLRDAALQMGLTVRAEAEERAEQVLLKDGVGALGEEASCRFALGCVAALMGGSVVLGRDGTLDIRTCEQTGWTAQAMAGASNFEELPYQVTGLSFVRESDSETVVYTAGSSVNVSLKNPLATETLTQQAYHELEKIPLFSVGRWKLAGGVLVEPGDVIQVITEDGEMTVRAGQVTMELSGGFTVEAESWGEERSGKVGGSVARDVGQIQADVAVFKKLTTEEFQADRAEIHSLTIGTAQLGEALEGVRITAESADRAIETLEDSVEGRFTELDVTMGGIRGEVSEVRTQAEEALEAAEDYAMESDRALANYASTVTGQLRSLQAQVDGQIETWYYDYEPTLLNRPATDWTTDALRTLHEGDLFYWSSMGYAYRFMKDGALWKWVLIQDTGITQAMASAAAAQTTANTKRRVFTAQPVPAYDVGDLWTNGIDLLTCVQARAAGARYTASDWAKQVGYTDDTAANAAQAGVERVTERVATVEQTAEGLKTRVSATESVANSAKSAIENLEVGGRNLLRGTGTMKKGGGTWASGTFRDSSTGTRYEYPVTDSPVPTCSTGVIMSTKKAGANVGIAQDQYSLQSGKPLTMSVWAKGTAGGKVRLLAMWWTNVESAVPDYAKEVIATGDWQFIRFTVPTTGDVARIASIGYLYWYGANVGDTCIFVAPKLEYGNIATDWTPAPEDIEDRVSKAESSITQNASNIALKVSKEDYTGEKVASMINLTPDTVQISGKKVNIAGNVLFQATQETANSAKSAIDNLAVGGRNLWFHTKAYDGQLYDGWVDNTTGTKMPFKPNTTENGFGVQRIARAWRDISQRVPIEPNTPYSLSAWVKWDAPPIPGSLIRFYANGTVINSGAIVLTETDGIDDYVRVHQSYITNENISTCRFECTTSTPFLIYGLKLEKGTIATDWTPAPEDTESAITTALETAQSKSAAYRQATAPTGADVQDGDVWFDTQGGGIYNRVNGQWSAHEVGTVSIADGAVTADKLVVDELLANAVLSQTIQAEKLDIGVENKTSRNSYSISTSDNGFIQIRSGRTGIPISSSFSVAHDYISASSPTIELSGQWDGAVGIYPCSLVIGGNRMGMKYDGVLYPVPLIQHGKFSKMLHGGVLEFVAFPKEFPSGPIDKTPTVVTTPIGYVDSSEINTVGVSNTGFYVVFNAPETSAVNATIDWIAFC